MPRIRIPYTTGITIVVCSVKKMKPHDPSALNGKSVSCWFEYKHSGPTLKLHSSSTGFPLDKPDEECQYYVICQAVSDVHEWVFPGVNVDYPGKVSK
jgi:hypothetical protein